MMTHLNKLWCWLFGHKFYVEDFWGMAFYQPGPVEVYLVCDRCGKQEFRPVEDES